MKKRKQKRNQVAIEIQQSKTGTSETAKRKVCGENREPFGFKPARTKARRTKPEKLKTKNKQETL